MSNDANASKTQYRNVIKFELIRLIIIYQTRNDLKKKLTNELENMEVNEKMEVK